MVRTEKKTITYILAAFGLILSFARNMLRGKYITEHHAGRENPIFYSKTQE